MERLLVFFFLMVPSLGVATSITAACVSTITSLSSRKSRGWLLWQRPAPGLCSCAAMIRIQ